MRGLVHGIARGIVATALLGSIACDREQPTGPGAVALARAGAGDSDITIVQLGPTTPLLFGARDISDNGTVVGDGFLWTPQDGLRPFPTCGAFRPSANGVNNRGEVVGVGCGGGAIYWTPTGEMTQLPMIGVLHDINNRGMAVGPGPAVWTVAAGVRYLAGGGVALGVNERGDVVGQSGGRATLWPRGGAPVTLIPGAESFATSVNNGGDVVGFVGPHFHSQGFVWSERNGLRMLETPAGWYSHPEDINGRGDVVGWIRLAADASLPGTQRAVLWPASGGIVELPGLAPGAGTAAFGINNRGDVVGSSTRGVIGVVYPVLWTTRGGGPA